MRTYPNNSPQAAARIVALAMLADGHPSNTELDLLDRLGAHTELGLQREDFHGVVHAVCEDLLSGAQLSWANACCVDRSMLAELMAEVDDAELQLKVLRLCISVAEADGHVTEGESMAIDAAIAQWGWHCDTPQARLADRMIEHA